jgi:hypothetical protein
MTPAKKTSTRGGARKGTGPKPADGATDLSKVTITIDPISDSIAKDIGEGDRSLGIRRALAIAKEVRSSQVRTPVRKSAQVRTRAPRRPNGDT